MSTETMTTTVRKFRDDSRYSHLTRWCAYHLGTYRYAAANADVTSAGFVGELMRFNPRMASSLGRYPHAVLSAEFARLDAEATAHGFPPRCVALAEAA